jgi:tRNA/rRNA methyltransferase
MEMYFILDKPAVAGNIGSAARALKTMGFKRLRLIDPCDHLCTEAKMFAHGSVDILEQAEVFRTFSEARKGIDFLVGTTAKKRMAHEDYSAPADVREMIKSKAGHIRTVGLVFGSEESGLPNEILQECDLASSIPLSNPYPSLNLAQAVMLYAYEFSALQLPLAVTNEPPAESFAEMKRRASRLLDVIGIPKGGPLHNRILERISRLGSLDVNLIHSVSAKLDETLGSGGKE